MYKQDIDILSALWAGNHMSDYEINRARNVLYLLNMNLKERLEKEAKDEPEVK